MEKITVKVCTGTTCFVMGGANLQELINIIPRKYGDNVIVEASNCLDRCYGESSYVKAPYVKINDDIIGEATVERVLEEIDKRLK